MRECFTTNLFATTCIFLQESRCQTDFWKSRRYSRVAFISLLLLGFRSGNRGDPRAGTDDQIVPKSVETIGFCPFLSGSNTNHHPVYKLTLAYLFSQFAPFIWLLKTLGILTSCHSWDTSNSFPLWDSHTCCPFPGKKFPFLPPPLFTWKISRQMTGYLLREEFPDYSV